MITLKVGDITQEEVDVIVNAANTKLAGGGGVDGAIHRAAGPSVFQECQKIGGCATGQAVITGAGKLKAKAIIHTVGPVWNGGARKEAELLESAYLNSFLLAEKSLFRSIALPAISTGVYGYPKEPAAWIAIGVGMQFEDSFDEIRFVCFSEKDMEIYQFVLRQIRNESHRDF